MSRALATLEAWKLHSMSIGAGGSNCFRHNGVSYAFDAHPRALANGALQGRIYRQERGAHPQDLGGFKIDDHGDVVALPEELRGVLPERAPEVVVRPDRFSTDDVEAA